MLPMKRTSIALDYGGTDPLTLDVEVSALVADCLGPQGATATAAAGTTAPAGAPKEQAKT